ncbi:MAG: ParB/RepB/Spo0J family partition protein [Pseudomonadota bacterium]
MTDGTASRLISVSLISSADRLRPIRSDVVASLAADIKANGLLQPIVVRPDPNFAKGFRLIIGAHRLEAVRELGWNDVRATVRSKMSDDQARALEISENLLRVELSPIDRAVFLGEWKRIYEVENPSAKRGGDRKSQVFKDQKETVSVRSFADYAADELGFSGKTIRNAVKLCDIEQDLLKILRAERPDITQSDLLKIARLYNREAPETSRVLQSKVVKALVSKPEQAVKTIIDQAQGVEPMHAEKRPDWEKLAAKFQALAPKDQDRFLNAIHPRLSAKLKMLELADQ